MILKRILTNIVKYFGFIYTIYFYLFSFVLKILRLFVKTDKNLILITSFGGKKFDDSPKCIFDAMKNDARFDNCRFVWAFHQPEKFEVEGADVIKTDTVKYFVTSLKAGCWITNSSIERGLQFKGKDTFYFNTWHGSPIKKMGSDISQANKSFKTKSKSQVDVMTTQSDFETNVFSRVFCIPKENFLKCGLPRNDELANYDDAKREHIRQKLGIPSDKKAILYAPTFREYERDAMRSCVLDIPASFKEWEDVLGSEYVLLLRAHYEVEKVMNIEDNEFLRNVSDYPVLNELMIASDILVSDYSSIFFDYSVMDKPMLHFAYDYDKYAISRGVYFDIRQCVSGGTNETELMDIILNMDESKEIQKTVAFRNKYVNYYGNAVSQSVDCIAKRIGAEK